MESPPSSAPDHRGRSGLIVGAAVLALALAVTGLVAFLGSGGESRPPAADRPAAGGAETSAPPQELEIPDGYLGVRSLGALTPIPQDGWHDYTGPGSDELLAEDAHAMSVPHGGNWISYLMVGRLGEFALDADPEDLRTTASEIVDTWVFDYPYSGSTGLTRSEPELTDTVVDSFPAVLLETRVSWDAIDSSPDDFEDVALLLVDPGEGGIFLGVAAVPESGTQRYEPAVEALLETTFQHNTYKP